MKNGEFQRFNKFCGIAKIQDEITKEEWFVVYTDFLEISHELGDSIGRGKTKDEAFVNAIINFNKYVRYVEDKVESFQKNSIDDLSFTNIQSKLFEDNVIYPIEDEEYIYKDYDLIEIRGNGKYINASIGLDEEGNAVPCIS
jgi:hypothetical protein